MEVTIDTIANLSGTVNQLADNTPDTPYDVYVTDPNQGYYTAVKEGRSPQHSLLDIQLSMTYRYINLKFAHAEWFTTETQASEVWSSLWTSCPYVVGLELTTQSGANYTIDIEDILGYLPNLRHVAPDSYCNYKYNASTGLLYSNNYARLSFCDYDRTTLSFSGSSIGRYALSGCENLESVTLTGSLTDLSHRFENLTGLKSVTGIPSTVTNMTSCFSGCTSLETIRKWSADTDNVTMTGCFTDCDSLTAVYVDYPAVSPSGCGWKYCEASLTASSVSLSIYDSSQTARTGARTKTVTYSGDKALELFNLVDELAAASAFTTAELDAFMQYKYPLTIDGEGYLSPSGDNFVLWAKDDEKVLTNFSVEAKWTAALFDHIYPVGSIYMSATDSRNPGTIFGFGSWYKLAPGRVLMGEGANEANTDSTYGALNANTENRPAGEKGGQYTHALTQSEMPRHNHANSVNSKTLTFGWKDVVMDTVNSPATSGTGSSVNAGRRERDWTGKSGNALRELKYSAGHDHGMTNAYTGGSGSASSASNGVAHSNMQPYLVVYMWYRYG